MNLTDQVKFNTGTQFICEKKNPSKYTGICLISSFEHNI